MKLKKIIAAIAAGAMALSMSVVNAFASTVTMNSEYAGAWALTAYIPKSELTAIGGDVKVTLHITPKAPLIGTINSVLAPTDANWTRLTQDPTDTSKITSDTAVAKEDGMLVVNGTLAEDTVSFVISADAINALTDDGLTFQANDLIVTSADLEAGTPEGALRIVNEEQSGLMIQEGKTYEEVTAPADEAAPEETAEEAPAADEEDFAAWALEGDTEAEAETEAVTE